MPALVLRAVEDGTGRREKPLRRAGVDGQQPQSPGQPVPQRLECPAAVGADAQRRPVAVRGVDDVGVRGVEDRRAERATHELAPVDQLPGPAAVFRAIRPGHVAVVEHQVGIMRADGRRFRAAAT